MKPRRYQRYQHHPIPLHWDALSTVQRSVLEHVARYRLTTRRGWRGAWELRHFDDAALARAVRSLVRAHLLASRVLLGSNHRFELTPEGAAMLGLPPRRGVPLSAGAAHRAYAQLLYATTGNRPLLLADRQDFASWEACWEERCGQRTPATRSRGYFFDPQSPDQWSRLLLDLHFPTHVNRIARRVWNAARQCGHHPLWQQKLKAGKLQLAVVTPSARRAQAILTRYRRYQGHAPLQLMVAPGLIPLARRS